MFNLYFHHNGHGAQNDLIELYLSPDLSWI